MCDCRKNLEAKLTEHFHQQRTGGPAFPCDLTMYDQEVVDEFQGMTLRDYFAAKAMQAVIQVTIGEVDYSDRANFAYAQADAMLEARKS